MIRVNGHLINFNHFPDGTTLVKYEISERSAFIDWIFESNEEILELYYIVSHLKANGLSDIVLNVPYLPNARQDRVKNPDDVFTLKYFANLINSLGLRAVQVRDVHSSVALALIDRISDEGVFRYVHKAINISDVMKENGFLFYPDEGAMKRYSDVINKPYMYAVKKRNWSTGKIEGLNIIGDVPDSPFDVMFVDDIIAFGGSLYHSAKALKELGARNIYAYITHVENSILKGDVINSGLVEKIYTTNSIFTNSHELIQVINL